MSRNIGTFPFNGNYEILQKAPLDARLVVSNTSDLLNPITWRDATNLEWLYTGMPVSVVADPSLSNNGLWFLLDESSYTNSASWVKVGAEFISDSSGTIWQTFQINQNENGVVLRDVSGNLELIKIDTSTFANLTAGSLKVDSLQIAELNGVLYAVDGSIYAEPLAKPMLSFDASILGDGITTIFNIQHDLDTKKQNVTVWDVLTDTIINPGIKKGLNINYFSFNTAPELGENYNVNIMGFR